LNEIQKEITTKKNQSHIGETVVILTEPASQGNSSHTVGRTDGNKLVVLSQNGYKTGVLIKVKITGASPHALKGQPI